MPAGLKKYGYPILKLSIPALLVIYAWACATIVPPTGGPKDITPPKMVSSEPKNLSTNFIGNKLIINFDEYIVLKSPEKYLLISPPMGENPDIKTKGRSVLIKIKDTLRENTTYNFYLGDAIVDLSESNPVSNFNFAFSTGPDIDSLSLLGNVTDAFTRKPVKNALVMLYTDFTDSVPKLKIPDYVSRTGEDGSFRLNNLASGKYRAVALTDANSDYMYNLPTETVGFSSDSVTPYFSQINSGDTNLILADAGKQILLSINMFTEPDSTQRILKSVIAARNKLNIAFRYKMQQPGFRALNIPDSLPWALMEWNKANDTLNAWLLNKPDTLQLEITERGVVFDTVKLSTSMKVSGKSKNQETATKLRFISNTAGGVLGYGRSLELTFANPVKSFNTDSLRLTINTIKDTSFIKPEVKFNDSIQRHLMVKYNWNENDRYDLYIPKGSFTDFYADSCDSTHVSFQIRPIGEYGKFAVTINRQDQSYPVIIQLLNDKNIAIIEQSITTEKRVDFGILPPGKYGLKAIMDTNGNGRWDTGIFLKNIQPERVLIHQNIFEVRTNWELEENWDL